VCFTNFFIVQIFSRNFTIKALKVSLFSTVDYNIEHSNKQFLKSKINKVILVALVALALIVVCESAKPLVLPPGAHPG
jgi:hypothetical protein